METPSVRRVARSLRARLIYRLDTWLSFPPVGQLLGLCLVACALVAAWALALRAIEPRLSGVDALWWSLTHLMDAGIMAGDTVGHRLVAIGATTCGVLTLSLVTAAFASKMNERIHDLRSGLNPVVERGHVLLLGFSSDAALVAREVARSGQRRTLVVLAPDDKPRVELALRHATQVEGSRARVVVRVGDPRSESALLRVAASRASSIVVIPPPELDDEQSVRWTLAALLAVRRVVEDDFAGEIVVEARHAENRDVLLLAAEAGVAGPNALAVQVVASDDIIARVLAQGARQEGVYLALRDMLAFNRREVYLAPAPEALVGLSFDEAHARVTGAVLLGLQRPGEHASLAPAADDDLRVRDGDRLVVLASGPDAPRFGGALPAPKGPARRASRRPPPPERVVILGYHRVIPLLVAELDGLLPPGSQVCVVCGDGARDVDPVIEAARRAARRATVSVMKESPCDALRGGGDAIYDADAVIIVGCPDEASETGDAHALANLLWLRHGMRRTGRRVRRVVTQVRDPRSALHVPEMPHDFVVSSAVVAMLLAQAALDPDAARVYHEILNPEGADVLLRPCDEYLGPGAHTFADAMAAARARDEVALGFMTADPEPPARPSLRADEDDAFRAQRRLQLNPPRDAPAPSGPRASVVVLTRFAA